MDVVAWILGIILAGTFAFAGVMKVLDFDRMREHFGYRKRTYQLIGLAEIAGAAGVVVGLAWKQIEWLGVAASVGLCTLMVGAVMAHARVDDEGKKVIPAAAMFVLSVLFAIFLSVR